MNEPTRNDPTPYAGLSPDVVLNAVSACHLFPDGRLLALNSYENRVWRVGIEGAPPVIAKFYRPGRWNDSAIVEEHAFARELADADLPVVAPLSYAGHTLLHHAGFRYALTARLGGRPPEPEALDQLQWLGRLIARMHVVGARSPFAHRQTLDETTMVQQPMQAVLASSLLPTTLHDHYRVAAKRLAVAISWRLQAIGPARHIRLHGDCHPGNILWTNHGPCFVDLDDARMGPAVQDLWMLAHDEGTLQAVLAGYRQFRDLDPAELALIPVLRAMRQLHYAGWIATRWGDPAFPAGFPFAAETPWWQQHVTDLHELAEGME